MPTQSQRSQPKADEKCFTSIDPIMDLTVEMKPRMAYHPPSATLLLLENVTATTLLRMPKRHNFDTTHSTVPAGKQDEEEAMYMETQGSAGICFVLDSSMTCYKQRKLHQ